MALTDDNSTGMVMPVQPMGGGYGGYGYPMAAYPVMPYGGGFGGGFDGFGGDWIILFLFAMMFGGGWGGMGGFGGWGGGFGGMFEFPWLLNGQNGINNNVNDGFRTSQLQDSVTSVRDGVSNLATQLCGCCSDIQMGIAGVNQNIGNSTAAIQNSLCQGFAGTTAAVTNAQNAVTQQLYNNELASLNRSFAEQTANTQGFNNVQAQLAQNGYNQAAGTADLKYTIATENCADRAALSDGIRDLLAATQAQTQTILTQLCNDKIEAKNDTIAQLRQELIFARGQASQDVQTARILAGQVSETDAIYNRLSQCPVNTVPVYGNQRIFTCNNGCGCGNGFAN